MARPWVIDMALSVNPMRLLTHAGVEQDRNEATIVLYPPDEGTKAARHIGNLSERGYPQRPVGRGVIDEVEKLVRWFDHAGQGAILVCSKKTSIGATKNFCVGLTRLGDVHDTDPWHCYSLGRL